MLKNRWASAIRFVIVQWGMITVGRKLGTVGSREVDILCIFLSDAHGTHKHMDPWRNTNTHTIFTILTVFGDGLEEA